MEIKYPCIKCTQQLYDKIKDILINVGYKECNITNFEDEPVLTVNVANAFSQMSNVRVRNTKIYNRYLCSNIKEFLIKVCELKSFEVSYIDFIGNGNAENHYFRYKLDKDNKTIIIHETKGNKEERSVTVTREKQWRKKNKKENYVVNCDLAIGESSTVVATMPEKGNDFDKDKGSDLDIDKPMEKINIADKLRHCNQGTKLYSPLFGEVKLNYINKINEILVYAYDGNGNEFNEVFDKFGIYNNIYTNSECLLFPSKDNRDWNSFQVLEEGHRVMCSDDGKDWYLNNYFKTNVACCISDKTLIDSWTYIVPVEEFDFTAEDITINKEKSII